MSRTSVVPDLIDAMVADFGALAALGDVLVCDGLPLTNDDGTYLFVGVDDPDGMRTTSADSEQAWPHATSHSRSEDGAVTLAVEAREGSGTAKDVRDEVYRVAGVVQDRLRASKTLGVPGVLWLSFSSHRLEQAQTRDGATALLTFRITFQARL